MLAKLIIPRVYFPCVIPLLSAFLNLSECLIADRVYILLFRFFFFLIKLIFSCNKSISLIVAMFFFSKVLMQREILNREKENKKF